jgi:histidyl-tRNA synthetase
MGVERIASLMEEVEPAKPDVFFALLGEEARHQMLPVIMQLREAGLWVEIDYAGGGLKRQMGLSDKIRARHTLIVGENELKSRNGILRNMLTKKQQEIPLSSLSGTLKSLAKS